MDNFRLGFSYELMEVMSKEAASKKAPGIAAKSERFKDLIKSKQGRSLGRVAGRGARQVAIGGMAHKLINPDASVGSAARSGVGMAAGGAIGTSLARQMGAKGKKAALISSFLGSALGIRAMRKGRKEGKSDKEIVEMALKKEGQEMVATATRPKRDATTGASPPSFGRPSQPQGQSPLTSAGAIVQPPQ